MNASKRQSIAHFKILKMNTALRIALFFNLLLIILACSEVTPPRSSEARLSDPAPIPLVETVDSTIPQKLSLLSGEWKGIGKDQGRTFTWILTNGNLEGIYLANKKVKEDYSKIFRFRIQDGVLCCFPSSYGGKCGTPDGTYRLTKQTDSSYYFLADHAPMNKTISTLEFSFAPNNRISFRRKHDREDYPDSDIIQHFQRQ